MKTYTYPISPEGQAEWKLSMIAEIFSQLKALGNKINDLPMSLRIKAIDLADEYGHHLMYSHVYDALDDEGTVVLSALVTNLQEKLAYSMRDKVDQTYR